MEKKYLFLILWILIVACSVKIVAPTEQGLPVMQQKVPGITIERANQGYHLYLEKCSGCHRLHKPEQFTIHQWNEILGDMYEKVKDLNSGQEALIREYLYSSSK